MSKTLPRKALISISSFHDAIYPNGQKTGLFFTEALHPFEVLTGAGFEVDLASETGSYGLDDISLTDPFLAGSDKTVYDNPKHPFNVKLNSQLKKASDLKKEEYGLFFASAGHSALYDYPSASGLQSVAGNIWDRGGVVAAVCHGPVLLPGVIDSTTGKSIIAGKTVTGFSLEGEMIFRILEKLKSDKVLTVVEAVSKVGADYSSPMGPFDDYSITMQPSGLSTINPSTGEQIETFSFYNSSEIEEVLVRAEKSFQSFRKLPVHQRAQLLSHLAETLRKNKTQLARVITTEMGKILSEAEAVRRPLKRASGGASITQAKSAWLRNGSSCWRRSPTNSRPYSSRKRSRSVLATLWIRQLRWGQWPGLTYATR